MNCDINYIIILSLTIMSFLYSSVGHGGASGYLAIMGLFSISPAIMKPSALVLNILVSCIAFLFYYRARLFKWSLFYPFALTSIPFSFLGGYIQIDHTLYKIILGIVLLFSIIRIVLFNKEIVNTTPINSFLALCIGALIGFLSGLLGIGGGIILSPILLFLNWGKIKETAAVSALFIFVNSTAGFIGFLSQGGTLSKSFFPVLFWVSIGGVLGSYLGANKFNSQILKYVLSLVLLIAAVKLIVV